MIKHQNKILSPHLTSQINPAFFFKGYICSRKLEYYVESKSYSWALLRNVNPFKLLERIISQSNLAFSAPKRLSLI